MPQFIPALDLAESYYRELIQPLLFDHFPGLPHAAALIGYGSEVLGFDTPMSMDHCWAPRLQLFIPENMIDISVSIKESLRISLPTHFKGFPLGIRASAEEAFTFFMDEDTQPGNVNHRVVVTGLRAFIQNEMNWDILEPLQPSDWLTVPSQLLSVMTAGRVFKDTVGELTAVRKQLAYYPYEIWLYLLACGWDRIGQEDALMQRAGFVGDELGSSILGSRIARDIMSLCFLMEKRYAPYPKWFGSAFNRLACATEFHPYLWQMQTSSTWQDRAAGMGAACELLVKMHNALSLTALFPEKTSDFHQRPFQVIHADAISVALLESITDPQVKRIAQLGPLGSLDQFSDSTILRSFPKWRPALKKLFEE